MFFKKNLVPLKYQTSKQLHLLNRKTLKPSDKYGHQPHNLCFYLT